MSTTKSKSLIVGKWFHSFDKKGETKWQGQVLQKDGEYYIVQLYEWLTGSATIQKIVHISDMKDYDFYSSAEDMRDYYDRKNK